MADEKQSMIIRGIGLGAGLGAAWLANKLVEGAWRQAVGRTPPKPDDDGDVPLVEILAAAAITGAVVALFRALATRGTAKYLK